MASDLGGAEEREPVLALERSLLERELLRNDRRERGRDRRVRLFQVLLLAFLLAGWALISGRVIDRLFLSDPWSVARAFWRLLADGSLWFHLRFTLVEMVLGYLVGAAAGMLLAVAVSLVPWGEPILKPFVLTGYAIPKIALAPLVIVWLGIGISAKIVLAASLVFFIVYFNAVAGIAAVSPGLISTVQVMTRSRLAILLKVILPNALPFIITALRITLPAALIGAMIGEFISSNRGVGYLVIAASSRYDTAQVFAGILSLLIFVLVLNSALSAFERRLIRWRAVERESEGSMPGSARR